jgi:predicted lipoprotein with Yx(FWY)xxD motif
MRQLRVFVLALAIAGLGVSAVAQEMGGTKVGQSSAGAILTDGSGMSLYTFTRDMTGFSNCNGPCAAEWPPLVAAAGAMAGGDWTIISRDDGQKQWAYKGRALYRWSKDAAPGDIGGDGFAMGKWHLAKP